MTSRHPIMKWRQLVPRKADDAIIGTSDYPKPAAPRSEGAQRPSATLERPSGRPCAAVRHLDGKTKAKRICHDQWPADGCVRFHPPVVWVPCNDQSVAQHGLAADRQEIQQRRGLYSSVTSICATMQDSPAAKQHPGDCKDRPRRRSCLSTWWSARKQGSSRTRPFMTQNLEYRRHSDFCVRCRYHDISLALNVQCLALSAQQRRASMYSTRWIRILQNSKGEDRCTSGRRQRIPKYLHLHDPARELHLRLHRTQRAIQHVLH